MRVLVDAHCLLWSASDPSRLNPSTRALLLDPHTEGFVSVATMWELAIKVQAGKLRLAGGLSEFISAALRAIGFDRLPIDRPHVEETAQLPLHHRDPFDRLLVAQARIEQLVLITAAAQILRYDVEVVWAGVGREPRPDGVGVVAESARRAGRTGSRRRLPAR